MGPLSRSKSRLLIGMLLALRCGVELNTSRSDIATARKAQSNSMSNARTSREHNSWESDGVVTNSSPQHHVAEASDVQATVEASDVQAIVLRPRPKPYRGEYVVLRIGDASQGREMLRRILPHVAPSRGMVGAISARLVGDRLHLRGAQGVGGAATVPRQFPGRIQTGHGGACRDPARLGCQRARELGIPVRHSGRTRRPGDLRQKRARPAAGSGARAQGA